jgi:hypothetical protein
MLLYPAAVTGGGDVMGVRQRARQGFAQLPPTVRRQVLHRLGRYAPWEPEFDFSPPTPGPGQATGPPGFVGIGVQKAGTTWWYGLLAGHPDVSAPDGLHKERHFFDRFGTEPFRATEIDRYHGWFPRRPGTLAGEWTPDYFSLPWVPPLLRQAAPEARLLLLLRDPIDRFQSGLAHQRRMGDRPGPAATADAVQRGFYFQALTSWLEHYHPSQMLVLQYERCAADPEGQLLATTRFLGLSEFHPPALLRLRTPSEGRPGVDPDVKQRLQATYEADVKALSELVPDLDLSLWPNFAYLAEGLSNSPTRRP